MQKHFSQKCLFFFFRSAVQVGPKNSSQEAPSVQRLPDHGEGWELAEEESHAGALWRHRLLRSCRKRLHWQRLPLLGGAAGSVDVVRNPSVDSINLLSKWMLHVTCPEDLPWTSKCFFITGTPSAWLTNRHQKMNGTARTRLHGCSPAATTTLWFGTMGRRCWWRPACSCGGWASCWTTTTTPCPFTTPWIPSTSTPLKSPSSCRSSPRLWSGTNRSWSSQDSPSQILSTAWPRISRSTNSSKWACAGKNRRIWRGWKPATDRPGDWEAELSSDPHEWTSCGGKEGWKYAHRSGKMLVSFLCSHSAFHISIDEAEKKFYALEHQCVPVPGGCKVAEKESIQLSPGRYSQTPAFRTSSGLPFLSSVAADLTHRQKTKGENLHVKHF